MDEENNKILITAIVMAVIFAAFAMGLGKEEGGADTGNTIIV
ncbi:hypothetical protein [Paenibacillus zeisoli]|nr:hypothetical protein [Paenibacillus zeisoli]